ncbi:MotA/TolQ/ExbB proton channel family protein [Fibrobacterota bacterium]
MRWTICLLASCLFAPAGLAKKDQRLQELEELKRELTSLHNLKLEKLEALEKAEAERWDQRYRQSAKMKQHEDRVRALETAYNRLATDMGRRQDDLVREGNVARELKLEWEDAKATAAAFENLIIQSIEKAAERISSDIPVGISERTLAVTAMSEKITSGRGNISEVLDGYFGYYQRRYEMTMEQTLTARQSFMEEQEYPVWRLQLGTVFIAELAKTAGDKTQILLRTGKLQGKVFAWRSRLAQDYNTRISKAVMDAVGGKAAAEITLDVLQNRSLGSGFTSAGTATGWDKSLVWFKKGGLVMYPLLLAALLGLLFSLERLFVLMRRSTDSQRFMKKLNPHLESGSWKGAADVCTRYRTSLGRVLANIISQAGRSRESGEKAARETMLREMPILEKRMVLIAAIGGSAPLMGLLGTVSGMISLFKVITDVGTNDPRILAGGISEALITTQTGLIIAIPILLIHGYLSDRMERIQNDITANSMEVMNKIWSEGR